MIAEVRQFEAMERVIANNIPSELAAQRQWLVWRYEQRAADKKPTKVPYQVNGSHASSVDPSHWVTFSEALAELYENESQWNGLGFVFSPEDDFIGIDLDDCLDGDGKPLAWAKEIVDGFATYSEVSPSGTGLKLFFRGEFPLDRGRKIKREDGGAIEVYTKGRYFTVTGNRFGDQCELANVESSTLASFADHYFTPVNKPELQPIQYQEPTASNRPDIVSRAHKYALAYPPAISGQGGHDTTFRLACVLVNGFELDQATALTILQGWNLGCQPAWSAKELEHKIKSAASVGASGDRGYMLTEPEVQIATSAEPVDHTGISGHFEPEPIENESIIKKPSETMPDICLNAPGIIGDIFRYIMQSALFPLPEVALASAIAVVSVIVCRKVVGFKKATPNLYLMAVAESGAGKDHPRKAARGILNAAGGTHLIGPESFASGSAITESLSNEPVFVSLLDEIGHLFKAISGERASTWLQEIGTNLLKVWGEGLSTPWKATARADAKYNREIHCPQPVTFGTTTPSVWGNTSESMRDDGLLARFLVFQAYKQAELQGDLFDESDDEIPTTIIDRCQSWIELKQGGNLNEQFPTFHKAPFTEEAKNVYRGFWNDIQDATKDADSTTKSFLNRSREQVSRLSLVAACACYDPSEGLEGLVIEASHVEWAIAITKRSNEIKLYEASRHLAESSHHKTVLKVKRIIQDAGSEGLTKSQLTNRTQWTNSHTRNDVLQGLIDGGEVIVKDVATKGRTKKLFFFAGL